MTPINFRTLSCAALVGLLVAAVGCGGEDDAPKQRYVKLNVKTVDVSNKPVAMVRFYINGKKFGITDEEGDFQANYEAKDGEVLAFNVEAPEGYSVPPNTDQSQWQIEVKYPKSGKLEVDFSATLQRPERDYLFIVRTGKEGDAVKVGDKTVGKTGPGGDVLLRISGVPGTAFAAVAGELKLSGTFADDDEIYLLTDKKQGALGGAAEPEDAPVADTDMVDAPTPEPPTPTPEPEKPTVVAQNDTPREPAKPKDENPFAGFDNPAPTPTRTAPARNTRPVQDPEPAQDPEPVPDPAPIPDPEPIQDPEPTPPPVAVPDPEPAAPANDGLDDLFADTPSDPPPAAAEPEPDPDPVAMPPTPTAGGDTPSIKAEGVARTRTERDRRAAALGDGLLDDGEKVDQNAMDQNAVISAGRAPSAAAMSRQEISDRLDAINRSLDSSGVLQKSDVDFLAQIDKTHPGYYEANRLLAEYYFEIKEYKRQAQALEEATSRGRYKHDPAILLSLAKSYAFQKNYGKALKTMNRVERKMRRLPPRQKADAYRFHAEMLEFEFLRQYHDDPKRANVGLVDKAISKWERYRTFAQGSDPGAVSTATQKIEKLTGLKREMEL